MYSPFCHGLCDLSGEESCQLYVCAYVQQTLFNLTDLPRAVQRKDIIQDPGHGTLVIPINLRITSEGNRVLQQEGSTWYPQCFAYGYDAWVLSKIVQMKSLRTGTSWLNPLANNIPQPREQEDPNETAFRIQKGNFLGQQSCCQCDGWWGQN